MFRLESSSVLDLEMALGYDPCRIKRYAVGREYNFFFLLAELAEKALSYPLHGRRSTALLCKRCPFFSLVVRTLARKKCGNFFLTSETIFNKQVFLALRQCLHCVLSSLQREYGKWK